MTESNVSPMPERPNRFRVRSPRIKDAKNFLGAVAMGNVGDETLALIESGKNQAAIVMAVKNAMATPDALDRMMFVFADLWEYEPPESVVNSEQAPDLWEYDPFVRYDEAGNPEKNGPMPRDEVWRGFSRRHRARLIKKLELEDEGLEAIGEFSEAVQQLPFVKDFLERAEKLAEDGSGGSGTPSSDGTGGSQTPE